MALGILCFLVRYQVNWFTVKPFLSSCSKIGKIYILLTNGSLMKVECVAHSAILLTCIKFLSVFKTYFGLLLSGRIRQVLQYCQGYLKIYTL